MEGIKVGTEHDSYEKSMANLKGQPHSKSHKDAKQPNHVRSMEMQMRLLLRESAAVM
jgi:hypothetical protein